MGRDYIPLTQMRINDHSEPKWFNNYIKKLIDQRNKPIHYRDLTITLKIGNHITILGAKSSRKIKESKQNLK